MTTNSAIAMFHLQVLKAKVIFVHSRNRLFLNCNNTIVGNLNEPIEKEISGNLHFAEYNFNCYNAIYKSSNSEGILKITW
jgi:hypothetical protein